MWPFTRRKSTPAPTSQSTIDWYLILKPGFRDFGLDISMSYNRILIHDHRPQGFLCQDANVAVGYLEGLKQSTYSKEN